MEAFYQADNIPSHSCVLMKDRAQAVGYPRGDLLLGFCRRCGFIQNVRFDPGVVDYTQQYEETQAFSPRFRAFAEELVETLIARHDLRNKHVFEVGCGKGEFLVAIAERGNNSGTGIDPGYVPERTDSPAAERLEFIRDYYSDRYSHLTGDLVATRHTLEHIAPVGEFMGMLRRSVAKTDGARLFVEVPDVRRVLTERAFWDVYYEHSSYFSLGSLGRLMRAHGFTVTRLELGFDDQYLLADGRLDGDAAGVGSGVEESVRELGTDVIDFGMSAEKAVRNWRDSIRQTHGAGQRVVLWGGGSKAVAFLAALGLHDEIDYVVDINPYKQGMFIPGTGQEVVGPHFLREYGPDRVIIMNPIYRNEITADLESMGLAPTVDTV